MGDRCCLNDPDPIWTSDPKVHPPHPKQPWIPNHKVKGTQPGFENMSPLNLFEFLFSDAVYLTADMTNQYGRLKARENLADHLPNNQTKLNWTDVDASEIWLFISMIVFMGIFLFTNHVPFYNTFQWSFSALVPLPNRKHYWSLPGNILYSFNFPSMCISGRRFNQILKNLRFASDSAAEAAGLIHDRLYKVYIVFFQLFKIITNSKLLPKLPINYLISFLGSRLMYAIVSGELVRKCDYPNIAA